MKESKFKIFAISSFLLAVIALALCIVLAVSMFAPMSKQDATGDANNQTETPKPELPEQDVPTEPKFELPDNNTPPQMPSEGQNSNGGTTSQTPEIKFANVGEKYHEIVKPLYDAAQTILDDLVESGKVTLDYSHNPRIVALRFENTFWITIRQDVYVYSNSVKSEFLQQEYSIVIYNFSESKGAYNAYRQFVDMVRTKSTSENYVNLLLPLAQNTANLLLEDYESYKSELEIKILNHGKQLILQADSSLPITYGKIADNLNFALVRRNYPLISNEDINISFGGNIGWDIVYRWILIEVSVNNFTYRFYLSFNENGEFSKDYLNYFLGTVRTGYTPADPDQFNPKNEDYADLFDALKIEDMDLSNLADSYGYKGEGYALYSAENEYSFLYF